MIKRIFIAALLGATSISAHAAMDCGKLYVGGINITAQNGLTHVSYKAHPDNYSTSYATFFSNLTNDALKPQILASLLAAKAADQTTAAAEVQVVTTAAGGCSIDVTWQEHAELTASSTTYVIE